MAMGGAWISLNDIDDEDEFLWGDQSTPSFLRWREGEPNDFVNEDCTVLNNAEWDDDQCDEPRDFICERAFP